MKESAFVDAHCHFDLFSNPQQVLRDAEASRIHCIAVTNTPSVFEPMVRLAQGLNYVRPALGLHPELAVQRASELSIFSALVSETKFVGEVGLDYKVVVNPDERAKQRSVFTTILEECARVGGRVLSIHSRRAEDDVLDAVNDFRPGPFILHWYSGGIGTLHRAVEAGAFFSVNAPMARSKRGHRLIQEIPRTRMLTESDGPFVEQRGRPASPSSVAETVGLIGDIWGVEPEEAQNIVFGNFRNLLQA
jgi:TatD DNase family protein